MTQTSTAGQAGCLRGSRWLLVVAGLAVTAAVGLRVATWWGPGISPDSVSYVIQAENLLSGDGYRSTHFPPLYPAFSPFPGLPGWRSSARLAGSMSLSSFSPSSSSSPARVQFAFP